MTLKIQCCILLLYVEVDEGSGIREELDSGQTKIMNTRGKAHRTVLPVFLKTILLGHFKYFRILNGQQIIQLNNMT